MEIDELVMIGALGLALVLMIVAYILALFGIV